MKNAEYWENRFKQLEEAQHKLMQSDFSEIEKQYAQTQQILNGQIALWYQRFADNNKITLAQAKQYVQGNALNELKWNVHEYIQHGKENAVSGNWKKELENASAKFHITKLEALKIQTQQSLQTLFAGVQGTVKNGMGNVYKSGYYHTAFELQKGFGVGFDISSIDQSQLEKIISKPWSPDKYNFSERIWGYKNQLISTVHNILSENIRLGGDPQKAIDKLSLAMNASKQNAGRLVMTEGAYFSSLSQHDCYEKLGVEKYEIVATLDDRTSETCISLDGKVYNITEFQAGATAPPFHPRCRTTTAPYLDYDLKLGERAARDGNGKTYYIPEDFTYPEWEKAFVDGDKSAFDLKVIEGTKHYSYKNSSAPSTPVPQLKQTPKAPEIKFVKANSIEEAEQYALNNKIRHVDYSDIPLETANLLNEAAMTLPEDIRPAYIASSKNIEKAIGRKLGRTSNHFYGVHLDVMDLRFGEYPNIEYDFEGGQVVGISSTYKKIEKIRDSKLKGNKIYAEKHDGHTQFFNTDGNSTAFHEMGHVYADKKGIPKGFSEDAEKWFKETRCDMLKDVDEAWAEAWGGYHTNNPDLPDYIAKYIHNATNMPINEVRNKRKDFDIFNVGGKVGDNTITPESIFNDLESSAIGKETLKLLENMPQRINLNYIDKPPGGLRGEENGGSIKIYIRNCKDVKTAVCTLIHEHTHYRYAIGQSQWAESVCVAQELKHRRNRALTISEKRTIIKAVKDVYPEYNWRKGGIINGRRT